MSVFALATGKLWGVPETRTSKNGHAFTKATLCVVSGNDRQFVTLFVFSETARNEMARVGDGESVSVQGTLKAEIYERDGQPRVSLSLTADHVLALKQPPRERKPKAADPPKAAADRPRPGLARRAGDGVDVFGDDMPF